MVDWWALGIVAFEFLSGGRPFDASSMNGVMKTAVKGVNWHSWSSKLNITYPNEAKSFIDLCLSVDPTGRPTYQKGLLEIRNHPWFKGVSFDRLEQGKSNPPFNPGVQISSGGGMAGALFGAGGAGIGASSPCGNKVEPAAAKYAVDDDEDPMSFRKKHK